jgi:hypothetical protein
MTSRTASLLVVFVSAKHIRMDMEFPVSIEGMLTATIILALLLSRAK